MHTNRHCAAFHGPHQIASGELREVALRCKALLERDDSAQILIFDDLTSEPIELDFRGTSEDVTRRVAPPEPKKEELQTRGPGRPKLGVVAREVTLLPRHWEWLAQQPGGASVALRKLVEQGLKVNADKDSLRHSQESTYRFASAMAGNEPGFEEAMRALFGGHGDRFHALVSLWPADIRRHAEKLAAPVFSAVQ
jgi:hypothetical protein